jgi:anti-sigma-K factor RskA
MNCESYDWKAYALGELDRAARKDAEAHAALCADCREEAAALRLTLATLSTLREEEMPRRIAFVSDKVFEPRWWQKMIWNPNFAAACVIAAAILVHAFARTGDSSARTQAQIDAAVNKAVAEVEARHEATLSVYDSRLNDMYVRAVGLRRQ